MQIKALDSWFPKKEMTQSTIQKECTHCEEPEEQEPLQGRTGIDWLDEFWVSVNGGKDFADDIGVDIDGLDFSRWSGGLNYSPNIQYGGNINGSKSKLNNGFSLSTLASLDGLEEERQAAVHTLLHHYEEQLEEQEAQLAEIEKKLKSQPNNQSLLEQKAILSANVNDLQAKVAALEL